LSGVAAPTDPLPIAPLSGPIDAVVRVPGSKSLSNRHLVLAALATAPVRLGGLLACDDCDRLLVALAALGVSHRTVDDGGTPCLELSRGPAPREARVDLGDGGTPTRFMIALAAAWPGTVVTIDGSPRMRERPVAEGIDMLRALGARIEYLEADGRLPVRVDGGTLRGGAIEVGRTASSQFISALMLAGTAAPEGVDIHFREEPTSASYIALSLSALMQAGAEVEVAHRPVLLSAAPAGSGLARITVRPRRPAPTSVIDIEPDASSAVYPAAAAMLVGGSVELPSLPRSSAQPDIAFFRDLALRGARVAETPAGALRVSSGPLRALDADYELAPDAAVMAMVVAACADHPSTITGLGTLRVKESDRIAAVAAGLRALGGEVDEGPDRARIMPLPRTLRPAAIDTVNDHRIAMAFAILGLARAGVSIRNPACVAKSYPGFWRDLDLLRAPRSGENRTR